MGQIFAKNLPMNLFEKLPGGKKEKKYLWDPLLGGTPTISRDIKHLHEDIFPRQETIKFPKAPPAPSLERLTIEEAREQRMKRLSRRRRRRYPVITGELEPQTRGKTLLG